VTESLAKNVPVIAYAAGGIPHQILHGVNGYLLKVGDTEGVAQHLFNLCTDDELYLTISGKNPNGGGRGRGIREEFTSVFQAVNWLFLCNEIIQPNSGILQLDSKSSLTKSKSIFSSSSKDDVKKILSENQDKATQSGDQEEEEQEEGEGGGEEEIEKKEKEEFRQELEKRKKEVKESIRESGEEESKDPSLIEIEMKSAEKKFIRNRIKLAGKG